MNAVLQILRTNRSTRIEIDTQILGVIVLRSEGPLRAGYRIDTVSLPSPLPMLALKKWVFFFFFSSSLIPFSFFIFFYLSYLFYLFYM